MLSWYAAIGCGAIGGLVAEAVIAWRHLVAWQQARHLARARHETLPMLRLFVDPLADTSVAVTRVLFGCLTGWLMHTELAGVYPAVAVGACAPALLAQISKKPDPAPDTTTENVISAVERDIPNPALESVLLAAEPELPE
jgi:hypothetical protein